MVCRRQAGPGTNHGPGHCLESSDQQTAQAVRSAEDTKQGDIFKSVQHPAASSDYPALFVIDPVTEDSR